jgi:hypothetical protein
MTYLESFLIGLTKVIAVITAGVIICVIALSSYVVIGVVYLGFPLYICWMLLKVLYNKLTVKLECLLNRGKYGDTK